MIGVMFEQLLIEVFGIKEGKRIYCAIDNYLSAKNLGIEESQVSTDTTIKPKEKYNPMKEMKERNDMIYQYYLEHDISYKELAAMFKVSYDQVRKLVSRRGVKKK